MKSLLAIFTAVLCFLGGCGDRSGKQPAEPAIEQPNAFAEQLIEEFNKGYAGGFTERDYAYPNRELAWKHGYCVMDDPYELEQTGETSYLLHTTYTKYISVESATSPEKARELEEHQVEDTYQAVTRLEYRDGKWMVPGASDVFSLKEQSWSIQNLFKFGLIKTT